MKTSSLRTRFIVAGGVLLAFMVASGAWSVLTFERLGAAHVRALDENQETINLAVEVIYALEHEDDAVLRALSNGAGEGVTKINSEREAFEDLYHRLQKHLHDAEDEEAYHALRTNVDAFRKAADALLNKRNSTDALRDYAGTLNPLLGQAISDA